MLVLENGIQIVSSVSRGETEIEDKRKDFMVNTYSEIIDCQDDDENFRKTISEIDEVQNDDPKSIVANSQIKYSKLVNFKTHKILCHFLAEIGKMNGETAVNLIKRI